MLAADLSLLLSPAGRAALRDLPPWQKDTDPVRYVTALRAAGHAAELVSAITTQAQLRWRAQAKFGPGTASMLFTAPGLEQATRSDVAARHAERFVSAGLRSVADLGCGIGGDAMALAQAGLDVTGVEIDPTVAAIAEHNLAPYPNARVWRGAAEHFALDGIDGVFLDPARRTTVDGVTVQRRLNPSAMRPSLDFGFALRDQAVSGGMKLGPALDDDLLQGDVEAQWVSVAGTVVELAVWWGAAARPGVRRAALVIAADGRAAELTAKEKAPDAEVGPLGAVVWEPDGAVIRAHLIGTLVRAHDGHMLDPHIALYTTSDDTPPPWPVAAGFRVRDALPFDERRLRQRLAALDVGTLEVKHRGVPCDPEALRARLRLRGPASATLLLTRVVGKRVAIVCDRITPPREDAG